MSESHFLPFGFEPKEYFEYTYGISHSEARAERIRFKVDKPQSSYFLSMPMHPSLRKVGEEPDHELLEMDLVVNQEKRERRVSPVQGRKIVWSRYWS